MKRVLLFVPGYLPGFKSGGPARTVANMVDALGDEVTFKILCLDRDLGDKSPYDSVAHGAWNKQGKGQVYYLSPDLAGWLKIISIMRSSDFDLINLNSFFSFRFSIFPLLISKLIGLKQPTLIGPRGEFSKGAIALKSTKKHLFIRLAKILGLYQNVIWHASTTHEANDIQRVMGYSSKIRMAIDIAKIESNTPMSLRLQDQPLRIIFISRISPKKNLISALKFLFNVHGDVIFDVFGPIEDLKYWDDCLELAGKLPANVKFTYKGALSPTAVTKKFAEYDLFLFPTLGENFGHVIAEALFAGLPVLIGDTTPWRNLPEKGLGWDISLEHPELFAECIEECCNKSSDEYNAWRSRIQAWAIQNIGNQETIQENRKLFTFN